MNASTFADPRAVSTHLRRFLHDKLADPRDAPLLRDAAVSSLLIPFGLLLFVPGVFSWPLAAVYLLLLCPRLGPNAVLLHIANHRRLFTSRNGNAYIRWVLPFFFGFSPGSYMAHHLGMHHIEGNRSADKSSTLHFRRDSPLDFCRYWLRFQFLGKVELFQYLYARRRRKLVRRLLLGEALHKGGMLLLLLLGWQAALVVVIIPYVILRWGLMMGNWTQHAFVDLSDPADPYKNSVTLINSPYNDRMYNDGYHCGHHVKATAHWADAPAAFAADRQRYAHSQAVVFDGLRGFQQLWGLLMLRRYDVLARHLVVWEGAPMSEQERIAFLKARVRALPRP